MKQFFKQLISFLLPVTMILIIPYLLLNKRLNLPILQKQTIGVSLSFGVGSLFLILGLYILIQTIYTFIRIGKGTLAPWSPTQKLIISGMYAYVRNPMISGVLFMLLGEAFIFFSRVLLIWFLSFFIINNIYFSLLEEPGLVKRFGAEYEAYRKNVPRWIPRLKPWSPKNFL